ncbi:MAG: Bifunctional glutamine synthetase adenylyltransferase/adenylyl-removing enzyme [bacterium]|nr:Bifunctional glutamine synthetase adenylyltransferase/adenylyl-removing enzyme [bacterium]
MLAECRNPEISCVRLGRILQAESTHPWVERALFEADKPKPLLGILCRTLSQSEFLTFILEREPGLLTSFESDHDFSLSSSREVYEKELHQHLASLGPSEPFRLGLARFRLHEVFRIAVRDITRKASIEILSRELSDLADVILQAAYERAYADTLMALGAPRFHNGDFAELAILSLGKHGSRELNFSSDLDLIFLAPAEGRTELENRQATYSEWLAQHPYARYKAESHPSARTRGTEFETFFTEVGTRLIELISEPGGLGIVYRIDMRLRPEGAAGPLVRTVDSALQYYQNWGQRWERQALTRARVSAGGRDVGEAFLGEVEDFIFRKYVDTIEVEETLRDMRNLRMRSITQAGSDAASRRRNVKNGPGGIRDIEFLVQAVQVLYGGQFPELRRGALFEIIRRIHQSGLMGEKDYTLLSEAYSFLRKVEHRVQMDDMQKYHLPPPGPKLEVLAASLGYSNGAALEEDLFSTMDQVHAIFRTVFRADEEEEAVGKILDQPTLSAQAAESLRSFGFRDPEAIFRSLQGLAEDPEAPHLNSKLRRLLKAILPRLLSALRDTPSPEQGWRAFEATCHATPARSTFLSIAEENPQLISFLVTVGAASPYLSSLLSSALPLGEELVSLATTAPPTSRQEAAESFRSWSANANHVASDLSLLRTWRVRADAQIASRFVLGLSDISQTSMDITTLAEFCLDRCIDLTWEQGREGMLVFGLGKLGGGELGFASDLDLMILYDSERIPDSEPAQRLASDLTVAMGARLPEGRLFPVDVRLRPHGKSAPLVPSVDGALGYYREEGQTWERLALSRLRPIWGDPQLVNRIRDELLAWVFSSPADEAVLAEVKGMRLRIGKEKHEQILKAGPGGLLDVEFIAQAGQLRWGTDHPEIRTPNAIRSLEALRDLDVLTHTQAHALMDGYLFLREIENRLHLLDKSGSRGLPQEAETLEHLVGCLNTAAKRSTDTLRETLSVESLLQRDSAHRARIRAIFDETFERGFEKV